MLFFPTTSFTQAYQAPHAPPHPSLTVDHGLCISQRMKTDLHVQSQPAPAPQQAPQPAPQPAPHQAHRRPPPPPAPAPALQAVLNPTSRGSTPTQLRTRQPAKRRATPHAEEQLVHALGPTAARALTRPSSAAAFIGRGSAKALSIDGGVARGAWSGGALSGGSRATPQRERFEALMRPQPSMARLLGRPPRSLSATAARAGGASTSASAASFVGSELAGACSTAEARSCSSAPRARSIPRLRTPREIAAGLVSDSEADWHRRVDWLLDADDDLLDDAVSASPPRPCPPHPTPSHPIPPHSTPFHPIPPHPTPIPIPSLGTAPEGASNDWL